MAAISLGRFLGPGELAETHVGTPLYMAPEVFRPIPFTEKCVRQLLHLVSLNARVGSKTMAAYAAAR